jgi:hypothetical protein
VPLALLSGMAADTLFSKVSALLPPPPLVMTMSCQDLTLPVSAGS